MPSCDLLVVSHASVVAANQQVYVEMVRAGVDLQVLVPARWRNEYRPQGFAAQVAPGLEGRVHTVRVLGRGRPQRHVHLASPSALLRRYAPRSVFVEEEPFSLAAMRWSRAANRRGVPFGVQLAETLDRPLPSVVARRRDAVVRDAAFVAARSPGAVSLARRWGAGGSVEVVAHGVDVVDARVEPGGPFTVAYVGRLVEVKGVTDLLEAVATLDGEVRLVVAGEGPLLDQVRAAPWTVALGAVSHDEVGEVYGRAHATCVPSRTSAQWEEQFGRVLVESLVRGVPVVATSTGEIPWVLSTTGGGVLVAQRDPAGLATALRALASDRQAARQLGDAGRSGVLASFTNAASGAALSALVRQVSVR